MAIKIEDHHITLSVRDLLRPTYREQMVSNFPLPQRGLLGRKAQSKVQQQKNRQYGLFHSEYAVSQGYDYRNYHFIVQGRIDGVYRLKNRMEIEEIKSVILTAAEFRRLQIARYPDFSEQLLFYAYLLQDELSGLEVNTYLILVNLVNDARRTFQIPFNRTAVEGLLWRRFDDIIAAIEREREEQERRKAALAQIDFRLPEKRPQQQEMMQTVSGHLQKGEHLLISAPTGTGKTAAALFPAIQYAYVSSKKIFFVTSKTTQQQIVAQTLQPLLAQGINIKALFLRASQKMCANDVYFCHEAFCPYLKDYHERLADSGLSEQLLQYAAITPDLIYEKAVRQKLCPFEVSMDLLAYCDVVIGDYNYVFDPAVYLRRLFQKKDFSDWILIIDEAHNLYERGMGYLSPKLSYEKALGLIAQYENKREKVFKEIVRALRQTTEIFRQLHLEGEVHFSGQACYETQLNVQQWQEAAALFESAFIKYLIHKVKKRWLIIDDPLEMWYYDLRRFVQVARIQDRAFVPFYSAENGGVLKIQCCDPSHYIGQRIDAFHSVVAMSATLDPIHFYRDVLGFPEYRSAELQLDSPFSARKRQIVIVPNISTRYKDRMNSYPKIAEVIRRTLKLKKGNYLAFFPSYDYIQNVYLFLGNVPGEVILQKPNMNEAARDDILDRLSSGVGSHLLMAVMGGVFSEGVDYIGQMAVGVFIISPALPQVSYERELLRRYYEEKKEMGMEYAYIYPGMNKVIQSVGRLIRTASDYGVVVLIGERFSDEAYHSLLPDYWFKAQGDVQVSEQYEAIIRGFWKRMKQ